MQDEVERAVQRYKADLTQRTAELAAAQERLRVYDAFVAEKDTLHAQLQALTEEVDELKKQHHKKMM